MRWSRLPATLSMALAATAGLAADAPLRPEGLRKAMRLKLGEWHVRSRIVDALVDSDAGVDKAEVERVAAILRARIGEERTETQCVSKDMKARYLPGLDAMPGCAFTRPVARKGRFAFAGVCKTPTGSARIAVEGEYAPDRLVTRSKATASTPQGDVTMMFESVARFAGKCEPAAPVKLEPGAVAVPPAKGD